nr:retrovirus-related Pol polyprotein from transposon TNT 1-94 [Tanacetum cinerariifolium]
KVLELEAKILKKQQVINDAEKRCAFIQNEQLKEKLQGRDDSIRNLQAQNDIMSLLNVGSTDDSCNTQALETELTQLKTLLLLLRFRMMEKIAVQKAKIATLNAKTVVSKTSGTTKPANPKVIALGMYAISPKYIVPQRRTNRETLIPFPKKKQVTFQETPKPSPRFTKKQVAPLLTIPNVNVPLSTRIKSATGASKPVSKSNAWIYRKLPAKSAKGEKVEEHIRNLNKNNRVNSHVKCSVSVKNLNAVCDACHECLISSNHDNCLVYFVKSVNRKQPKAKNTAVQIVLWYLDFGCSRHITGDRSKLINYVEKFIGIVRFRNNQFAKIVGYGDYKLGDTIISRVYYVEGLNHNLFSVGQFCDGGLEVAFRQHTCHIRNMDKVDLLQDLVRRLPLLKYDKDHLCPCCQLGKSKKASHPLKTKNTNLEVLSILHMDLCKPMRNESINKKKYLLVIMDDYTRFGWVRFLRNKDETPEVFLKFLKNTQCALNATIRMVRTDNRTEFVNKTLTDLFESVGITHQTIVPRSPQQNDVVERRNRTLMEAARIMLIFAKAPLFLWAKAVATACYTLNRSLIHTLHGKTYYELLKGKKPDLKYFRVFGSLCYPTNDYDDVGKLKAKADICIFVGYTPTKKAYRVYNKQTRKIQETVHVTFDELSGGMTSEHVSSGLGPNSTTFVQNSTGLELNALQSGRTSFDLFDELFQPWIDEDEEFPPTPTVPVNAAAIVTPSTTLISEGAPAVTISPSVSESSPQDTSVHGIETPIDDVDSNLYEPYIALESVSEASSSTPVNADVTPNSPVAHIEAMQEEIHEFKCLDVWVLVPAPNNILIIPLKWIFKIKLDEYEEVLKNKARLVAKGYRQEAGIDFEESFSLPSLRKDCQQSQVPKQPTTRMETTCFHCSPNKGFA